MGPWRWRVGVGETVGRLGENAGGGVPRLENTCERAALHVQSEALILLEDNGTLCTTLTLLASPYELAALE